LDATPLKPPFDIKRGIPLNQLPDLLGHILDFLPEDIKQPSQSSVTKILNSIPDVSVSAEQDALKRITKNLGKQGLLSPRLNDHHSEDVYMPDPGSKPNPLSKKILLGLVGVAGAGIVATLGWLFDPKNLSTATEAGQHLMSIVAA